MAAHYTISPLNEENAREITTWSYLPPFNLYDPTPEHFSCFLDPDYRYHQVLDQKGNLVGFCCFGLDAQVPGGSYQLTETRVLDIGVGLWSDLVGQGLGLNFVSAVLDYAAKKYQPACFRVTIAYFNQRSQNTFLKLGFKVSHFLFVNWQKCLSHNLKRKSYESC